MAFYRMDPLKAKVFGLVQENTYEATIQEVLGNAVSYPSPFKVKDIYRDECGEGVMLTTVPESVTEFLRLESQDPDENGEYRIHDTFAITSVDELVDAASSSRIEKVKVIQNDPIPTALLRFTLQESSDIVDVHRERMYQMLNARNTLRVIWDPADLLQELDADSLEGLPECITDIAPGSSCFDTTVWFGFSDGTWRTATTPGVGRYGQIVAFQVRKTLRNTGFTVEIGPFMLPMYRWIMEKWLQYMERGCLRLWRYANHHWFRVYRTSPQSMSGELVGIIHNDGGIARFEKLWLDRLYRRHDRAELLSYIEEGLMEENGETVRSRILMLNNGQNTYALESFVPDHRSGLNALDG